MKKGDHFMKSKYGLLSVAFAAASMLLNPADAKADGGSWWGRVGYGIRVNDVRACIDDFTLELRVAFLVPGSASRRHYAGPIDVSASLFGDVLCDDHHGYDGWYSGWAHGGGYYGYGPYAPGAYSGYGKYKDTAIVSIDGFRTLNQLAYRQRGSWYFADFDLIGLEKKACHYGYLEDIYVDHAFVYVNGRPYYLDYYDLELCGDTWYSDAWYDGFYEGWDD